MYSYYPNNVPWSFYVQRLMDETVQGAADFNECQRALARIADRDFEAWYREWIKTAVSVERLAGEALKKGRTMTAKDAFLRAFTYYRTSQFWLEYDDERKTPAFAKALTCFQKFNAIPPVYYERLEIPFEGTTLPGYFSPAQNGGGRKPVVLYVGGADTFAEQLLYMGVSRITRRGMSCLTITGPGQGDVLRTKGLFSRPDYEKPIGAVLDVLEKRKDVDAKKMAVMGTSMGGYYGARGASLDRRAVACLLFGACYSVLDDLYDFYPPLKLSLQHLIGAESPEEARKRLEAFTLKGVIEQMTCPLLIHHGAEDFIVSPEAARKTYEGARCAKELRIWTAEEGGATHCMADNRAQAYAVMFDWLAEKLT